MTNNNSDKPESLVDYLGYLHDDKHYDAKEVNDILISDFFPKFDELLIKKKKSMPKELKKYEHKY